MVGFSDQMENSVLDHWLGGGDYTRVTTVYLGLSTQDPLDTVANNSEPFVSGNGYARVAVVNSVNEWPAAASGSKRNANVQTFPEASSDWGTQSHVTVWNHPSSANATSNYLASGALGTAKAVSQGDTARFPANSLGFTMD